LTILLHFFNLLSVPNQVADMRYEQHEIEIKILDFLLRKNGVGQSEIRNNICPYEYLIMLDSLNSLISEGKIVLIEGKFYLA
jgi:hypothetical protein